MNYFEIKNLRCAYVKDKVVLDIKDLSIPKGKVVFIVGESGCGKSTILETLGLMNNTIYKPTPDTRFIFSPESGVEMDCCVLWKRKNKNKVLSEIRRKYFSFIFQQTNLMRNFKIQENALIPMQIKSEGNMVGHKKYADMLKEVGLEQILVAKKSKVEELSGGQQQRLAFVRAFMPDFQILFGDEPTGNLDPVNADKLMQLIRDEIHSEQKKTAIIVSHTPELYNKYADVIIEIQKCRREDGDTYGLIDEHSIKFTK